VQRISRAHLWHQGIWSYNKGYDMMPLNPVFALNEIKSAKVLFSNMDPPLETYIAICERDITELEKSLSVNSRYS
jgi:hypothetical protein